MKLFKQTYREYFQENPEKEKKSKEKSETPKPEKSEKKKEHSDKHRKHDKHEKHKKESSSKKVESKGESSTKKTESKEESSTKKIELKDLHVVLSDTVKKADEEKVKTERSPRKARVIESDGEEEEAQGEGGKEENEGNTSVGFGYCFRGYFRWGYNFQIVSQRCNTWLQFSGFRLIYLHTYVML